MPIFIKTGYWEKLQKGFRGYLNLDDLIQSVSPPSTITTDELAAIQGANSPNATNSFATMNDLADISGLSIQSAVVVETTSNAKTNGVALIAAYTAAKALTPNGEELSATNRACVIIPPGNYDLDHGEDDACVPLTLDTEFVDIIGLTTDRSLQQIYGTPEAINSGVIVQTADDVHISNLYVKILTEVESVNWDNTDSAAYFPSTDLSNTVVDNCQFDGQDGNDFEGPRLFSMRMNIEYSGTFNNCTGGYGAFGGFGTASGTFTNCTGGEYSFGGFGTASGTFTNCTGGGGAFGGDGGTASGTFSFCKINGSSFPTLTATVATVEIVSGGTNYEVDDELTVTGGTGTSATLKVTSVDGGVITGIQVKTVGAYTAKPSNPVATTGHTGDATFNLTWNEGHIYGCVDSTGFIMEVNWDD